jgi:hypothetical protein
MDERPHSEANITLDSATRSVYLEAALTDRNVFRVLDLRLVHLGVRAQDRRPPGSHSVDHRR